MIGYIGRRKILAVVVGAEVEVVGGAVLEEAVGGAVVAFATVLLI
jgi:hypothetical protein